MVKRILVVDDEENTRHGLGRLLTRDGYVVAEAAGGREALRWLEEVPVQLVISDLCMPGMDGLALLRELRRRHPGMPVIMMTAAGEVESYLEAMSLGAVEYLPKPVSTDELRALVRQFCPRLVQVQL